MSVQQYVIVFDTNSYRNLAADKSIEEVFSFTKWMKEREATKGILAYGSHVVGMEILGNLGLDEKRSNYSDWLKCIGAMANHCIDDANKTIHFISHPYIQLTKTYFDVVPSYHDMLSRNLARVVADFKEDFITAFRLHGEKGTFTAYRNYIEQEEAQFVDQVFRLIQWCEQEILQKHPSIQKKHLREKLLKYIENDHFVARVGMGIIYNVAKSLDRRMEEEEHVFKAYYLERDFPFCVRFYQWILHRIVGDTIDMRSKKSKDTRWNWRWDYEVSFLINNHPLKNRYLFLVTDDGEIVRMLDKYGYGKRVMDLAKYLKFLEL
jgi:hypothetical protein